MNFPLDGDQLFLLTLITTLIVQFFAVIWVGLLRRPKPSKGVMRLIVFVVAVAWGYADADIVLPPLDDPMQFAIALLSAGSAVLVLAHNAYKVILEGVLEWVDAKILRGRTFLAP